MTPETPRILEASVEVNAPASAVWRALTESEELTRWFPPVARVVPGEGGSIFLSWGDGVEGTAIIEVCEPNRRLRVVESYGAVDYLIEAQGQVTVLRIVHSGFGADASFDEQYDGAARGWEYFLYNLKHYLEAYDGQARHLISARLPFGGTREQAWPALIGAAGLQLSLASDAPASSYRMRLGDREYSGAVIALHPARSFAGTVNELTGGLFFMDLEWGAPRWHCGLWLSVYGARPDTAGLQRGLQRVLDAGRQVEATSGSTRNP